MHAKALRAGGGGYETELVRLPAAASGLQKQPPSFEGYAWYLINRGALSVASEDRVEVGAEDDVVVELGGVPLWGEWQLSGHGNSLLSGYDSQGFVTCVMSYAATPG